MKIVVFDAKPYDIEFFDKWNETFGANITYIKKFNIIRFCIENIRK